MTILSRPTPSSSFRSWRVVAVCLEQQLCVQERTATGLGKNRNIVHRLFYRKTDLAPYRIIHSTNPIDYQAESDREAVNEKDGGNNSLRLVLAVATDLFAILRDWENVKASCGKSRKCDSTDAEVSSHLSDELTTAGDWTKLDQRTSAVPRGSEDDPQIANKKEFVSSTSTVEKKTSYDLPRQQPEERKEQRQRHLNVYDMYVLRVIHIWEWRDPVKSLLYLTALFHICFWCNALYWPILSLATLYTVAVWCSNSTDFTEREWVEKSRKIQRLMILFRCHDSVRIIYYPVALVLAKLFRAMLLPELFNYLSIVEQMVPLILFVSFLYTGRCQILNFPALLWKSYVASPTILREADTLSENRETGVDANLAPSMKDDEAARILPQLRAPEKALRDELVGAGPFSHVVQRTVEFSLESNDWVKCEERKSGFSVWEKRGCHPNKCAVLVTARIPGANVGSLRDLLLNKGNFENKKEAYAYRLDNLLSDQTLVKVMGWNEVVVMTRYKTLGWENAPLELLNSVSCANLFTPAQQEALQLRRSGFHDVHGNDLMAFAQCSLRCPDDVTFLPPSLVPQEHQSAVAYTYLVWGIEEQDGSLTLRICCDVDLCEGAPEGLWDSVKGWQVEKAEMIVKLLDEIGQIPNIVRPYVNARDFSPLVYGQPALMNATQCRGSLMRGKQMEVPPSSTGNAEELRVAGRFVQELLHREWRFHSKRDGVSLWTTTTPWTDKKAVKTIVFIPQVGLEDVDAVVNDLTLLSQWSKNMTAKTLVREISAKIGVFRTTFRIPIFGIAPRDMVGRVVTSYYPSPIERATICLSDNEGTAGGSVFLYVGEDAADELPIYPNCQRGRAFLFGVLAEEAVGENGESGVRLTQCVAADPCGSLPTFIIDGVVRMQLESTGCMAENVKRHAAEKRKTNAVHTQTSSDTSS